MGPPLIWWQGNCEVSPEVEMANGGKLEELNKHQTWHWPSVPLVDRLNRCCWTEAWSSSVGSQVRSTYSSTAPPSWGGGTWGPRLYCDQGWRPPGDSLRWVQSTACMPSALTLLLSSMCSPCTDWTALILDGNCDGMLNYKEPFRELCTGSDFYFA